MMRLGELWSRHKPAFRLPELIAISLLSATTLFYVTVLEPAEQRLRALENTLEKQKSAGRMLAVSYQTGASDPSAKLQLFYTFFKKEGTFAHWLARLFDQAERAGVDALQADYRRSEPADVPLVLQQVTLPLTGDYSRIRMFAEGALNAIPIASLDQITLRRQRPNQPEVEAELKFTFYLPSPNP